MLQQNDIIIIDIVNIEILIHFNKSLPAIIFHI